MRRTNVSEERWTTRQRIEIAFSRFLDAVEESDDESLAFHAQKLAGLGVSIGIRGDALKILRSERASSLNG